MKKKLTVILPLFLLAFTFFFKQCEGCQKQRPEPQKRVTETVKGAPPVHPETAKLLPTITFSMGFPAPVFDLTDVKEVRGKFRYETSSPYLPIVSVVVNLVVCAGLAFLLLRFCDGGKWNEVRKVMIIICVNLALFNVSVFIMHMPDIVASVLVYVYLYPVGWIKAGIGLVVKLDSFNLPSRIYFVLLTAAIYGAVRAVQAIRASVKAKRAVAG